MLFKKNENIKAITDEFVGSSQFNNFKIIMEDAAIAKFQEMQSPKAKTYDEMLADKKMLNFYMTFAESLESTLKIKQDLDAQNAKKVV